MAQKLSPNGNILANLYSSNLKKITNDESKTLSTPRDSSQHHQQMPPFESFVLVKARKPKDSNQTSPKDSQRLSDTQEQSEPEQGKHKEGKPKMSGRRWRKKDIELLELLHQQRLRLWLVAKILDRTESEVRAKLEHLRRQEGPRCTQKNIHPRKLFRKKVSPTGRRKGERRQ